MTVDIPLDVEQLARLTAIKTGKTLETIVKEAIEARAQAAVVGPTMRKRTPDEIKARIDAIIARVSVLPVLDSRSDDEILGYNEYGVPE